MSIPPLVCSTPPPPEQCEDDKDQEDFDLNYQLSQEDDETNDYDYSNFSSFNHYQTTSEASPNFEISQNADKHICNEPNQANTELSKVKPAENGSTIMLEDDILEDLNLKIDDESASSSQKRNYEECDPSISDSEFKSQKDLQLGTAVSVDDTVCQQTFESRNDNVEINTVDPPEESVIEQELRENSQTHLDNLDITETSNVCIESEISESDTIQIQTPIISSNSVDSTSPQNDLLEGNFEKNISAINIEDNSNIDEFEDFDDFQFVSSVDKPTETIFNATSDNPWDNNVSKDDGFGDFAANFGDVDNLEIKQIPEEMVQKQDDTEDDFGDFDEFKSVNDLEMNRVFTESCDEVSVLNFQSTDTECQIIERINTVMHTIFQNEIEGIEDGFESKLEGSLGETWGYLRETDIRQPYIVNWNNSLAQKTLLKALCIDSRNILFGPKWGSSMPKYAATLSAAPLQPQKKAGQSNTVQSEISSSEKPTCKTWSDPFTADGQEFTYAEALLLDLEHLMATLDQMSHNHSALKISELLSHACHNDRESKVIETGPTDLDVFEAATSSKPDKIYSNTINIQPMRQINLPDTHIFTPTNSEIPRSKTIHYDNTSTPTVLLPQSVPDSSTPQPTHSENDNDYWEFQDFRGVPEKKVIESTINDEAKDIPQKSNDTFATQVLQPIKLEPIMPTLNWPDPGEVKETFDDFTDFMSNLPSNSEKQETIPQSAECANKNEDSNKFEGNELKAHSDNRLDDEFDMFQSALPSHQNSSEYDFTKPKIPIQEHRDQASSSHVISDKMTDFDIVFSKVDKPMPENISLPTGYIENAVKSLNNPPIAFKSEEVKSPAMPLVPTNILQPSPATSSLTKQSQQKTSQILQPLSLESYSQINWPNPGIDLQDLSRFNPVESLQSFKSDSNSQSKTASPVHNQKILVNNNQTSDDDIWGEFVSSKPKQAQIKPKNQATFADDEEWTEFVSSPSVNPQNGLNTISLNVHTNLNMQKSSNPTKYQLKNNELSDIPSLNYITPKSNKSYNERHFQNL